MKLHIALNNVLNEIKMIEGKYPLYHSAHEGYAVLLEEVDELWDEVKRKEGPVRDKRMQEELIQIAAVALRFLLIFKDDE